MTGSRAPIVTGQVAAGCRCRKSLPGGVNIHLDTRAMDSPFAAREVETHIVVAVSRAESQDSSDEKCRTQAGAHLNLGRASEPYHLPLIAFVQELQHVALSYFPFLVLGALLERFLFSKMVSGTLPASAFVRTLGPRIEQLTPA